MFVKQNPDKKKPVWRLRYLCAEIYKTINNFNTIFMNEVFKLSLTNKLVWKQYFWNLNIRCGEKSLRIFNPKIWNNLPFHLKSAPNLLSFKHLVKSWNGISCKCNLCESLLDHIQESYPWKVTHAYMMQPFVNLLNS